MTKLETLSHALFSASMLGQAIVFPASSVIPSLDYTQENPALLIGVGIGAGILTFGGIAYALGSSGYIYSRKKEELVTDGPYSVVRHPVYLGFRLGSLGMTMMKPSLDNLIASAAVLLTTELVARVEEKKLSQVYGEEFEGYQLRVPRWIPYAQTIKNWKSTRRKTSTSSLSE